MAHLGRPPVMLDVIEEHFEELDFLWEQREGVIFAPDWNLDELAELEERAEAHLDGLRLAELHAVDIARPHLAGEHASGATTAAFVFMESGDESLFAELLAAFAAADAPARAGIRIGLRHSKLDALEARLFELARDGDPGLRAAAADVLAFQRRTVPELRDLAGHEDDEVRALVFGALGRGKTPLEPGIVEGGLRAESATVKRAVLEAAARSGTPGLRELCLRVAAFPTDPDGEAIAFLGVLGDARDLEPLRAALANSELAPAALRGLGALGRIEAVPLLLDAMSEPEVGQVALRAFSRITGFVPPPRAAPPPTPRTVSAEFDDEPPPVPVDAARGWWAKSKGAFPAARRVQAGRDVLAAGAFDALPLQIRRDLHLAKRASDSSAWPCLELEERAVLQRSR